MIVCWYSKSDRDTEDTGHISVRTITIREVYRLIHNLDCSLRCPSAPNVKFQIMIRVEMLGSYSMYLTISKDQIGALGSPPKSDLDLA
jgi:hypothetical protein